MAAWLFGSTPFLTTFSTTPVGGRIPTSFHVSFRRSDGSEPRYRSTRGFIVARSKVPTKTKVKSLASAKRSL